MDRLLEAMKFALTSSEWGYTPQLFRPGNEEDENRLVQLLERVPHLSFHDQMEEQLAELVIASRPSEKLTTGQVQKAVNAHLNGTPAHLYGVWVYYPWSNRLVHLLDEAEFVQLRTDRNRNKITAEEQASLATKRIGVIGLSVGRAIAITMVQERILSEIRLADFDTLALSNLNRVHCGLHDLGVNKALSVAREIAEIDPFIKVKCFQEGLTDENMDPFFLDGGKLDVLVEECDGVDIKIKARLKARELRVPVIMDTSDRSLLDVERFDLEPDRPILHGWLEHLDLSALDRPMSNKDKIPYLLPMVQVDSLSPRMKASMMELEETIGTWPQLASSVALGGATITDITRRILLDQHRVSGRWSVDLDEIIPSTAASGVLTRSENDPAQRPSPLEPDDARAMITQLTMTRGTGPSLPHKEALMIMEAGALAPSAGNLQPWKFSHVADRILVFHEQHSSYSFFDRDHMIAYIGLGGCVENMRIQGRSIGFASEIDLFPIGSDERLICALTFRPVPEGSAKQSDPEVELAAHISDRVTDRKHGRDHIVTQAETDLLKTAAEAIDGAQFHCVTEKSDIERIASLTGIAERIRVLNPIAHGEFFGHEVRWTPEEVARTRDGLDIATLELDDVDKAGLSVASDHRAVALLRAWQGGKGLEKLSGNAIRSSSAVGMISMPSSGAVDHLNAGRAAQRMWLAATRSELAVHPISAAIFLSAHAERTGGAGMNVLEIAQLKPLRTELLKIFGAAGREPVFMVRLSKADPPTARALRKPIEELVFELQLQHAG